MKVAIILSGCGVFDGSEIHEAVLTMLAVVKNGGKYEMFAPDIPQFHVINHLTGEEMKESRNVLYESARIARGQIHKLSDLQVENFDAVIMPGGFGAAKNLSDLAFKGAQCSVLPELEKIIKDAVGQSKPIGALCISPAVIAKVLKGAEVTIGNDADTVKEIKKMGGIHTETTNSQIIIDRKYNLVTTPCYMLDATILDIANSAEEVVRAIFELCKSKPDFKMEWRSKK